MEGREEQSLNEKIIREVHLDSDQPSLVGSERFPVFPITHPCAF